MDTPSILAASIRPEYPLRLVAPGIYSVLPPGQHDHRYDQRASAYDAVIGSEWYNRLVWGTTREQYAAFAQRAVRVTTEGAPLLDAGCGSMVFTAAVYAHAARPVIAIDQSLGMLQQAQSRLQQIHTQHRVLLLQADLFDLPFRADSVGTVLSMGMLHLFNDIQPILKGFETICQPDGALFLTSLVQAQRAADAYLRLLAASGELALPRRLTDLHQLLIQRFKARVACEQRGNMAYCVAQVAP